MGRYLQSDKEFKKLDEHLHTTADVVNKQGHQSAPEICKDGSVAKLTTAVTMLASRMEDMLKAQAEMQQELRDVKTSMG
jgi:hypothetical protein